jgi:hypothetical protein
VQSCTRAVKHDQGALELRADDPDVETHPDGRTVGVLHSVSGGSTPPNLRLVSVAARTTGSSGVWTRPDLSCVHMQAPFAMLAVEPSRG